MYVINRSGVRESIRYDKITDRNIELASDLDVDVTKLSQLVIQSLKDGMTTSDIDLLSSETAFYMSTYEPQYDILASRIAISNLHKSTKRSFSSIVADLYNSINKRTGKKTKVISKTTYDFVMAHMEEIDNAICHERDYNYNYFGFKTLEKSYLLKIDNKIVERPQHMLMRVAIGIHGPCTREGYEREGDLEKALETYRYMSQGLFTHASPTLFNAGSESGQYSSCFLLMMEDELEHIYTTNLRSALISKHAGGIGIDVTNVRSKGSSIHSTNGTSDGIVPMIQTFNATARYCNQGGKRKGSIAMYLQPWHPDIFEFVALRYNTPPDEIRARDIFLALWIPDIFMRRVEKDEMWSLICPSVVPRLTETYGEEFEQIYEESERNGLYVKQIKARELWNAILSAQEETGMPYINYKDSINKKSNQKNIGIIRSSNLCSEIVEYTDRNSVAVCNLASIALPRFYKNGKFDFDLLREVVRTTIINLNKIIDINFYPVKEAETNNLAYRPVGLGIQGLADLFAICKTPWGSDKAKLINRIVFECIYYYALEMSYELSQIHGSYSAFEGSPASQGVLQYHMWNTEPLTKESHDSFIHPVLDWNSLIERVKKGLRNSLLIACMPTASTAQILGNNESIEPFTSNIYSRNVLSGTFTIVNQHLYKDLKEKDLWTKRIVDSIISHDGSIQEIPEIPLDIKELYKTVWEIPQKVLVDYSIDRGAFIDQTQSLNIFMAHPTHAKLSSMHLYSWKNGAKTSNYYIRSKPSRNAVKFTIMETKETKETKQDTKKKFVCVGEEGCLSCGA